MKREILLLVFACSMGSVAYGQQSSSDKALPPAPMSGREMFHSCCAVCRGDDGVGKGPAAVVMKTLPPDLTQLSARNGGKFPLIRVQQTILGDVDAPAHGAREMPIYGELFRDTRHDEAFVRLRLSVLVNYISSIQEKQERNQSISSRD